MHAIVFIKLLVLPGTKFTKTTSQFRRPPPLTINFHLCGRDFAKFLLGILLLISTLPVHARAFFPKPLPISPVLAVAYTWFL